MNNQTSIWRRLSWAIRYLFSVAFDWLRLSLGLWFCLLL